MGSLTKPLGDRMNVQYVRAAGTLSAAPTCRGGVSNFASRFEICSGMGASVVKPSRPMASLDWFNPGNPFRDLHRFPWIRIDMIE